ncbi:MAG: hypothetical protein IKI77_07910 [Oscillospiraceae bacterium]|nr:hypothetical protein [Oscillospiraceae bacterium]
MLNVNFMQKGDEVLSITDHILAIRRKNGEVDLFKVIIGDDEEMPIYIDPVKLCVIGYGNGTVEKELDDGTKLYDL